MSTFDEAMAWAASDYTHLRANAGRWLLLCKGRAEHGTWTDDWRQVSCPACLREFHRI